jgi:pyruvate-formate lyase-activating enzyme
MEAQPVDGVARVEARSLFRLPWSMADNAMSWLEPTRQCNMVCDACFHFNDPKSVKSLDQIEHELETMLRLRKCDAMLIAGGEPLTHPNLVDVVRLVKSHKCKPVIITNGVGLDRSLLKTLKDAGAFGFTFHIDAHQARVGWKGKTETQLNQLRQEFADMLHEAGGLSCSFHVTVFPDTLQEVPAIVRWASENIDRVHVLTLIAVRMVHRDDPWSYFAGGKAIDMTSTPYVSLDHCGSLTSQDMYEEIKKELPHFEFNAFLGGTVVPNSLKWVIGSNIGSNGRSYGSMGRRVMEMFQNGHHFFRGRYLAYTKPSLTRNGKSLLLLGLFDRTLRNTARRYLRSILGSPLRLLEGLYVQSISAVQPVDILPNGETDTCDGCPNKTFWNDQLVSACQLEEYMLYGTRIIMVPTERKAQ